MHGHEPSDDEFGVTHKDEIEKISKDLFQAADTERWEQDATEHTSRGDRHA